MYLFLYYLKYTTLNYECNRTYVYNNKEVCINIETNFHLFSTALSSLGVSQLIYPFVPFLRERIALTKWNSVWWWTRHQFRCFGKSPSLIAHFLNIIVLGLHLSKYYFQLNLNLTIIICSPYGVVLTKTRAGLVKSTISSKKHKITISNRCNLIFVLFPLPCTLDISLVC